jgi:hypothetical protein
MGRNALLLAAGLAALTVAAALQDGPNELTIADLRTMVLNLGYETKELSKETGKFEFTAKRDDLDIPIAVEVSASKRYVWLTVFLGEMAKLPDPGERAMNLLKQNFKTQPAHFYVTDKGNLMLGMPIDNRGLAPAILRRCVDKIAADTASTTSLWQ